ncbi:PD-(D/E)XK nuclease family protein [archaeon]|nr:PD-(D/E)XK nuclease family protein [archaeon]
MVFKNEFSWSKSRDGTFGECKRKYFFNHYGFWDGWIASEDDRIKRIYYLKKLATKELWMGSVVHGVIEFILRRFRVGEEVSLGHALAVLRKRMESDFAISKLKEYTGFMSKAHRFFEDEYGIEISDEERKGLGQKAEKCLRNFYNSDIFMEIRRTPVEDWITLEDFLSFDFEGTQVYLSIDFAMKVGDEVILYDWKTGGERKADYKLQLSLYALYVSEKLGIPADRIKARMFYLALGESGKVDSFEVDSEGLEEVREYLRASVLEMKKLLVDVTENEAVEEDFEKSEGFWCSRCNFRKVCLEGWGT